MEFKLLVLTLSGIIQFPITASVSESDGGYHWKIDIVRHVPSSLGSAKWQFVKMKDLSCSSDICTDIYAKIRALHDSPHIDNDEFSRVTAGMNPRVIMMIKENNKENNKEELHIVDPLVVESDHCMCLQNATFQWILSSSLQSNCLSGTTVCELVFAAPVPITRLTVSIMITVESSEASLFIPSKSIIFYNTINFVSLERIFNFGAVTPLNRTASARFLKIKRIPENSGLWVLPVGKQLITTCSEFEGKTIAEIILPKQSLPEICSSWDDDVRDILSLPDRLLVATKFGLLQYYIVHRSNQATNPVRILQACIERIDTTSQASESSYYVMALSNNSETFYFGQVSKGEALVMKPASNSLNQSICQFLTHGSECEVRAFASSALKADKLFVLVKAVQYLLVSFSVGTASFEVVQALSQENIQNSRLPKSAMGSFDLIDMSFTQLHAYHLFIWGSVLLYSPNAGQLVFKMVDLKDEIIQIFETSFRGDYVFVTNLGKVYFGKVGTISTRHLKSVETARSLTVFFDSTGGLYQLVSTKDNCNTSACLKKLRVPVRDSLLRENTYLKIINRYRFCTQSCRGDCEKLTLLSCQIDHSKTRKIERTCPFAKIKLKSSNFQFFSRISLTLHCRDKLNSKFATKLDEVGTSLFWKEKITANSTALDNCLWEDSSHEGHRLPASISLGRGICYEFFIQIFLDHRDTTGLYFHDFKLEDIRLSVIISRPDELIVKLNRSLSYGDDSVKYKIDLCDSGKKRKQNPPGTGQDIISPELKVVGSELNCIPRSYQEAEDVQGYFAPKILLGCPAGQKVVFDPQLSKSKGKANYCDDDSPTVPCFHFEREFSPIFRHVDEATLKTEEFSGNYTLVIVAGGTTLDNVRYFSEEEKKLFNYEAGWLCSSNSPCSGIAPVFPHPPVFYFIVEFSNRNVDNSNCDFTFHFAIKIEGLAPGSINPSLIIVLISIGLMIIGLLAYFVLKKRYNHVLERFQWVYVVRLFQKPNKVEMSEEPGLTRTEPNAESV
ncbi:cation channel sperm-associated protein subunit gamma 1-like isoform X2 [Rhopilema esculentum]|uniref:cation channel sperm-associated protein subunit gamma 1-like isoform X2 n=1 Tax=Rhopilema esculentum TaxID=499914 RepID=UPI0031D89849